MLINGKAPLASGTLVTRVGETVALSLGGESLPIEFLTDGGACRGEVNGTTLRFFNADTAIGAYTGFAGTLNNEPIQGTIASYYMNGDQPGTGVRVIHYTFVRV